MDNYFYAPARPVTLHAPYEPVSAIPLGNRYQINNTVFRGFWSVRGLWLQESWMPQSEAAFASPTTQATPAYIPYVAQPHVVMISW